MSSVDAKHYSSLNSKGDTTMHTGLRFDQERIFIHGTLFVHLSTLLRTLSVRITGTEI